MQKVKLEFIISNDDYVEETTILIAGKPVATTHDMAIGETWVHILDCLGVEYTIEEKTWEDL